jgi:hypothetical protein
MNIELNGSEKELLRDILVDRLGTLRQQLYHAEAPGFKDELRKQRQELQGLIDKLPS